jgi:hypothetical protein
MKEAEQRLERSLIIEELNSHIADSLMFVTDVYARREKLEPKRIDSVFDDMIVIGTADNYRALVTPNFYHVSAFRAVAGLYKEKQEYTPFVWYSNNAVSYKKDNLVKDPYYREVFYIMADKCRRLYWKELYKGEL